MDAQLRRRLTFSFLSFALIACVGLVLAACGVQPGLDDKNGPNGNYKPTESDLEGVPASFAGSWTGACRYNVPESAAQDCKTTIEFIQDNSMITATMSYTINGATRTKSFKSYAIRGNRLETLSGTQAGSIGKGGFELLDDDVARFSVRSVGRGELAVLASRLPQNLSAAAAAPSQSGFIAKVQRQ